MDYVDERGRTPLFFAALHGRANTVKALIAAGAKIVNTADGHGVSALNHATRNNHVDVVKELLAAGADAHQPDAFGGTAHRPRRVGCVWGPAAGVRAVGVCARVA